LLNPNLPRLVELQALDLKLTELKLQQSKIPDLLRVAEAPLQEAIRRLQEVTESLENLNKERRNYENDLEAQETQVGKLRGRLTELKTNKEYQAHLFEIEVANKKKGETEERILLHMERIEQHQQAAQQTRTQQVEAEQRLAEEKEQLEVRAARLTAELEKVTQARTGIASQLEKALLTQYTKLKAAKKEVAVAPVRNGTCGGCQLQIPPQLIAEVRRSDQLQTCTFCHRILYLEAELPSGQPVPTTSLSEAEAEAEAEVQEQA
jgi:uncharacterized protein